jgi:hypothetical protein
MHNPFLMSDVDAIGFVYFFLSPTLSFEERAETEN